MCLRTIKIQYHYFFECGNNTIHRDRLIMETLHICRLTQSFYIEILTPLRPKTKSYLMPSPNMLQSQKDLDVSTNDIPENVL